MKWIGQFICLLLLLLLPFGAMAQSGDEEAGPQPSFSSQLQNWDRTAEQAKLLLESDNPSDEQLQNFRKALNLNRTQANQYVANTQSQVQDLQSQLDALTPAAPVSSPDGADAEEAKPESEELKQRRAEVEKELSEVQGNVLSASQIVKEANGLIDQIDARLRLNYYNALLTRTKSPINWESIQLSGYAVYQVFSTVWSEVRSNFSSVNGSGVISQRWPTAFFFMLVGGFILYWSPKLARMQITRTEPWPLRWQRILMPLAPSFVAIMALTVGIRLFLAGLEFTELFGPNGKLFLAAVYSWSHFLFAAIWLRWLVLQVDGNEDVTRRRFGVSLYVLALVFGIEWTTDTFAHISDLDDVAFTTLNFILIIIGAVCIWNLTASKYYSALFGIGKIEALPRVRRILRQLVRWGTILTLFLSFVGYYTASYQMYRGVMATAFLIFWGIHFGRFVVGWVATLIQELGLADYEEGDIDNRLWPILIEIAVWVVTVPMVLMAWGIPRSTIVELWSRMRQGLSLGQIDISFTGIIKLFIALYVGYLLVNGLKKLMEQSVLSRTKLDLGARAAIVSLTGYLGYTIAALVALSIAGFNLSAIGYIAGALSVGIGFGLQNIVQNFISGIILLVERPVKKGDWVRVGSSEGYVQNIAVRSTAIRTFDDSTIIVPNADLITNPVVNWFHDNQTARVTVGVGVTYEADPDRVAEILLELVDVSSYKQRDPNASVVIRELAESSVNYELRFWINDADWITRARSEIFVAILKRFKEEGIEIPYPQRDVNFREMKPKVHPKDVSL